ncbi:MULTISPECIES: uroporphyrinogen-III synthase [Mumia]|uniref:uroporphyrinogen-III synthase n=1 Tax=Mumia TaxID=1546255 RepID=UPI0014240CF5|nr:MULTISPECIES: uroporphyrinogen-III synthase [unclassified Mumia]QMW64990.1 uroporphyrinogen-III synthase [Mumia sp. ZJ1417]
MTPLGAVLSGTSVLVTAQRRADDLAMALGRRGAVVSVASALGVESQIDEDTLLERTRELVADSADVVVVTTGIGFRSWLDTAEAAGLGEALVVALSRTRLVARGPKARGALQAAGLVPDWVAESETSAEIADFLCTEGVAGQRIVVQHHGAGDDGLEERLRAAGGEPVGLVVYRWGPPPDPDAVVASVRDAAAGAYDAVVFTSAPGAAAWITAARAAGVLEDVIALGRSGVLTSAAVGPVTAEPLRVAGLDPIIPDRGRLGSLVRTLIMHLGDDHEATQTAAGALRLRARAATLDHDVVGVSPSGLAVLRSLVAVPGAVVSREALLRVLPGCSTDPHTAEVAVARLREAFGGRPVVETVVKRGYRINLDQGGRA